MPASVYGGKTLQRGIIGAIASTSPGEPYIQAKTVKSNSLPIVFGKGVMQNADNTYSAVDGTTTATTFAGVSVAEVKQRLTYPVPGASTITPGAYTAGQVADVCKRGEVFVTCVNGTPTLTGTVYMRIAANASFPNEVLGDFRANADGANTIALTNVNWDSNSVDGNLVTTLKIRGVNN